MRLIQEADKQARGYAMAVDYCKIFSDNVDHLYTLSLLLTADHSKAEQCFVAGLEDCVEGNPVFREWAEAWAVRTIIKNAIRIISPSRNRTTGTEAVTEPISDAGDLALAITELPPFERFGYVMSVLERYSDRECSLFLDCTVQEIANARTHAFQQLPDMLGAGKSQAFEGTQAALSLA
jgi:hypothetical protein